MTFTQEVVGGAVPKNYFPAVEKGIQESVVKAGPLAAYPVVGVEGSALRWILSSGRFFRDGIQDRQRSHGI